MSNSDKVTGCSLHVKECPDLGRTVQVTVTGVIEGISESEGGVLFHVTGTVPGMEHLKWQWAFDSRTEFTELRPPEPQGLGAVVREPSGQKLIRVSMALRDSHPWMRQDSTGYLVDWKEVSDQVEVLSDGYAG